MGRYLAKEPRPLGRRNKIRHSQNILYPHASLSKNMGLKKSKKIAIWFPEPMEKINYLELLAGGEIVNDNHDDFTVMNSPEELVRLYRARVKGKIAPIFNSSCEDGEMNPLQWGRILGG
jgi:hypothetical protein